MNATYKTLFEVKLMHEYFLTDKSGKTPFALADQKDRFVFLENEFTDGRESITRDLGFTFPAVFNEIYRGYQLKLLPSYSGFRIVGKVKERVLADNSLVYEPEIPLPDDLNLFILATRNNHLIDGYTNSRINRSFPALYFFSNAGIGGTLVSPYLTSQLASVSSSYAYEQGELASYGPNDTRAFYPTTSSEEWESVKGNNFAGETDRLLVPLQFPYSFVNEPGITQAVFTLKSKTETIKEITVTRSAGIRNTLLDFSDKADILGLRENTPADKRIFSLEVSGNNGFARTHPLVFTDTFYDERTWGVVHLQLTTTQTSFNVLGTDKFLVNRRDAGGVWADVPVFEIPLKSRFAYWRYINDKGKDLKLTPELTDYLQKEGPVLLTKRPRILSQSYFLLEKQGTTDVKYLPNPVDNEPKTDSAGRWFLDIRVPKSDLFQLT